MLFVDYCLHLVGEDIMFDEELSAKTIKINHGDKFVASVIDNKVTLLKIKNNGNTAQTDGGS